MVRKIALALGIASLVAIASSFSANAATVASVGTGVDTFTVFDWTGSPGSNLGPAVLLNPVNPAYDTSPTSPPSFWVWQQADGQPSDPDYGPNPDGTPPGTGLFRDFQVDIDLTGFVASSAVLTGLWGADNNGAVYLNSDFSTPLALLTGNNTANFSTLSALVIAGLFVDGINTLHFVIEDNGLVGGFRAAFAVDAVPIPPAFLLFGTALLGLGFLARSRPA